MQPQALAGENSNQRAQAKACGYSLKAAAW
jgi:hypothetical protein